jgi:hypothetical protein
MLNSVNSSSWIPIGSYGDENPKLSPDILGEADKTARMNMNESG